MLKILLKFFILFFGFCITKCFLPDIGLATHNLAGQITYSKVSPNYYKILLTTYTDPTLGVDRCTADFEIWSITGFGTASARKTLVTTIASVPRMNGSPGFCSGDAKMGITIRSPIKKNLYETTFRFNGPGVFEIRYRDLARVNYVKNMQNSGATSFYLETILNNNPFMGDNNSPVLLNDPIDDACTNKIWTHNPGGYDPDGDSLVYELINCQQYDPPNIPVPVSVNGFASPGSGNGPFTIDSRTGIITWNTAKQAGWYNAAILIKEYRNGKLIGYVIRDMALNVKECRNNPPQIVSVLDTCVKAGTLLKFPVKSWDPDQVDSLYFYLNNNETKSFNGPFSVLESPAQLLLNGKPITPAQIPIAKARPPVLELEFVWQTTCAHVRQSVYQVDYYCHDNNNYNPRTPRLAANFATTIQVVASPVQNVNATPDSRKIKVSWDRHECSSVLGYEVYRSTNVDKTPVDTVCCTGREGLPSNMGYVRVGFITKPDSTFILDDNFGKGLDYKAQYCYRVLAIFPGGMKSCASKDTCIQVFRDMPVIINNSVEKTEKSDGELFIRWTKPDISKIRQDFFPPPYTYKAYRAVGQSGGNFQELDFVKTFEDTFFIDKGLNTAELPYQYIIKLLDATGKPFAESDDASSIYLSIVPGDQMLRLIWKEYVPWINTNYDIYRKGPDENTFSLLTRVKGDKAVLGTNNSLHTYVDKNLEIGKEYCYQIKGWGTYLTDDLDTLINFSNIKCAVPVDTVGPCLPGKDSIFVKEDCENFIIDFSWLRPDSICGGDIAFYSLYYKPNLTGEYKLVLKTNFPDELKFNINNGSLGTIVGCYAISATDKTGNESNKTADYCFDNCPIFEIPNIFTPNSDGINDILKPISNRSIEKIVFRLYDRWGVEVNTSNDINNLWDGKTKSGSEASEGQYFYNLELIANNMAKTKIFRSGSVTLVR